MSSRNFIRFSTSSLPFLRRQSLLALQAAQCLTEVPCIATLNVAKSALQMTGRAWPVSRRYSTELKHQHASHQHHLPTFSSPMRGYEALLSSGKLKRDDRQLRFVQQLEQLHQQLQTVGNGNTLPIKSLYVYGGVGCGKTMMMRLLYDSVHHVGKQMIHFNGFMSQFHKRIHQLRKVEPKKDHVPQVIEEIASRVKLLCFDEMQVTDIADAMILKRLFEALMEKGVVVVATSNRPPSGLYENGINRSVFLPFIDFLNQKCIVWNMDSPNDYRLSGERLTNVYLVYGVPGSGNPSDAEIEATRQKNNKELDTLFDRLVQGQEAEQTFLEVLGRMVLVPKAARGVAMFTFDDICQKALAANDFMEIAKQYHTVFIKDIPQMGLTSANGGRNVIRRFILLIDELYQNNVKIVCSAQALPQDLLIEKKMIREGKAKDEDFFGIDEVFAFERTISRLCEAGTAEYLQKSHSSLTIDVKHADLLKK